MRTYTLKEAAKKINVSPGIIRQWEKSGLLKSPRTLQGARFYTDADVENLLYIQQLYSNNLGKEAIQDKLQKRENAPVDTEPETPDATVTVVSNEQRTIAEAEEFQQSNTEKFFEAMETYKQNILNEIKEMVRQEMIDEIKKEISTGALYTIRSLSEPIYKANAKTNILIQELTSAFDKANERNIESFKSIDKRISKQTIETTEEFYNLSKQLSETAEEIAHYLDITNDEIVSLSEAVDREREYYVEDREQFRQDIRQRELAFQSMLSEFREAAAAKTNKEKWWKIW